MLPATGMIMSEITGEFKHNGISCMRVESKKYGTLTFFEYPMCPYDKVPKTFTSEISADDLLSENPSTTIDKFECTTIEL
jgi:hypothetical protein